VGIKSGGGFLPPYRDVPSHLSRFISWLDLFVPAELLRWQSSREVKLFLVSKVTSLLVSSITNIFPS
jgi:hypothetical protein